MITDKDIEKLKAVFATKEDLKSLKAEIIEAVRETLENGIILILNQHEARIDRLEKHVGGFPSIV